MIKFLIDTVSSNPDIYGNRYHFATVTGTQTGLDLHIKNLGGERNAEHYLKKLTGCDWSEIHSTHSQIGIRDFNRAAKFHDNGSAFFEHELTAENFEIIGGAS